MDPGSKSTSSSQSWNKDKVVLLQVSRKAFTILGFILLLVGIAIIIPSGMGLFGFFQTDAPFFVFLVYSVFGITAISCSKRFLLDPQLRSVTLNRREKILIEEYGVAYSTKKSELTRSFDELEKVRLTMNWSPSRMGGAGSTTYHVAITLQSSRDEKGGSIEVSSSQQPIEAWNLAQNIAQFCKLPLEDSAEGDTTVISNPDEVGTPLRERILDDRTSWDDLDQPVGMLSTIKQKGNRIEIDFAPFKLKPGCFFSLAFVVLWLSAWIFFYFSAPAALFDLIVTLLVTVPPTVLIIFYVVLAKGRRQRLIITTKTVELEQYNILPPKKFILQRKYIREVVFKRATGMNPKAILIRSSEGEIKIENVSVPEDEINYLRNFIEKELSR